MNMTAARVQPTDPIGSTPEPAIALTAAPRREPCFDDEAGPADARRPGRGAAPLPFPRAETPLPRHLAVVPAVEGDREWGPAHDHRLPDPARFGRHFVQGVLEVLSGHRAPGQLARSTSAGVQAGLLRERQRGDRLGATGLTPLLHSVRVMEPAEGVAELSAVIQIGRRYRAIAARLESADGRWRCVRLQIG